MKLPNWEYRLRKYISANEHMPFCWGRFDCVLFAAQCADYITGHNYSKPFLGRYHTALGARKMIESELGGGFANVFDNYYKPTPAKLAQSGDIVLAVPPCGSPTYGIQNGDQIILATEHGLRPFPAAELYLEQAWRVS